MGSSSSCCETQIQKEIKNEVMLSMLKTYQPLLLVGAFLVGTTILVELKMGELDPDRAMRNFMGGFFLFFAFFKFLDLKSFVEAFRTYDVVARRCVLYAWSYPFIELILGVAYVLNLRPNAVNLVAAALMLVGSVGVFQALKKKQAIECACLGTVFKLPMTKVTLFENGLMFCMALSALAFSA